MLLFDTSFNNQLLQTITIEESNGNLADGTNNSLTSSVSNEDLSLSEYTDADESMSAPTEFLAEVSCWSLLFVLN